MAKLSPTCMSRRTPAVGVGWLSVYLRSIEVYKLSTPPHLGTTNPPTTTTPHYHCYVGNVYVFLCGGVAECVSALDLSLEAIDTAVLRLV